MIEAIKNWFSDGARVLDYFIGDETPDRQANLPQRREESPRVDAGVFSFRGPLPATEREAGQKLEAWPGEETDQATQRFTAIIDAGDIEAVFADGPLSKSNAVAALRDRTGCKQSTAYLALGEKGRFARMITRMEDGRLGLLEDPSMS